MIDIAQLLNNNGDFLDYEKVQKELINQFKSLVKIIKQEKDKNNNYNYLISKKLAPKKQKERFKESIKEINEQTFQIEKKLKKKLTNKERIALLNKAKKVMKQGNEISDECKELVSKFIDLKSRIEPIWLSIINEKKNISKALWKSRFIYCGLKLLPLLLLLIILSISFLSDRISYFLFSFNIFQSTSVFFILTICYYYISNIIIDNLYKKQLRIYVLSSANKILQLKSDTTESLRIIEKKYVEFFNILENSNTS